MRRKAAMLALVAAGVLAGALVATLSCTRDGSLSPDKLGDVNCALDKGGLRHQRPCDAQFATSTANIKIKADVLKKVGVELGLSKDKLAEVTDKTLNSVVWLRDLCADWNACAVSVDAYQERKAKLVLIEDNYFSLVRQAEKLKTAGTTKGPDDPAIRDLAAQMDVQIAEAARLSSSR